MKQLLVNAYAKINLSLDILSKREDGYHEVCMIMQSLALHDDIMISLRDEPGVSLSCSDNSLPCDEKNLAYKAAVLFFQTYDINSGCHISIEKRIPVAAGLAGGSSDAAAVLYGLWQLTGLSKMVPLFDGDSAALQNPAFPPLAFPAKKLGADVPYCLMLGTALSRGIGEKLTKLKNAPDFFCLLVKPEAGASTKQIYTGYDELAGLKGNTISDKAEHNDILHPDTKTLLYAIENQDKEALCHGLCNVLEPVTSRLIPEIQEIKETLLSLKADGVLMSGSGPTVFALFSKEEYAKKAEEYFLQTKYADNTFLTGFQSGRE